MHAAVVSLVDCLGKPNELQILGFVFLVLPSLLKSLVLILDGKLFSLYTSCLWTETNLKNINLLDRYQYSVKWWLLQWTVSFSGQWFGFEHYRHETCMLYTWYFFGQFPKT